MALANGNSAIRIGMNRTFHNGAGRQRDFTSPERLAQNLGDYFQWTLPHALPIPIDRFWISAAKDTDGTAHFIFPHGEPSLAVFRQSHDDGSLSDVKITLCLPAQKARWHEPAPNTELIAFRLKPELASAAFGVNMAECYDAQMAEQGASLINGGGRALIAAETGGVRDIANALFEEILRASQCIASTQSLEAEAARRIRAANGSISITALAQELDTTERTLRRRFKHTLGVSPKTYARQLRISAAAMLADHCIAPGWADIAVKTGFYDQAHMITEYKALTGSTPKETHAFRRALSGFSNTRTRLAS